VLSPTSVHQRRGCQDSDCPVGGRDLLRDLLRRRCFLVRRRGELLAQLNNTCSQYNVVPPPGKFSYAANRVDLTKSFDDPSVRRMLQTDVTLAGNVDKELTDGPTNDKADRASANQRST
jgi:hypothetical protein